MAWTTSFLILLATQCTAVNSADSNIPEGCPQRTDYDIETYENQCYLISHQEKIRTTADLDCAKFRDGELANPKTEEINSFLAQKMVERGLKSAWIGPFRVDSNSRKFFSSNDGTPAQYTNFGNTGWAAGIFSQFTNGCVYIDDLGYWHESDCHQYGWMHTLRQDVTHPYICETTRESQPAPETTEESDEERDVGEFITCPLFDCNIQCELDGYEKDEIGCPICKCDS